MERKSRRLTRGTAVKVAKANAGASGPESRSQTSSQRRSSRLLQSAINSGARVPIMHQQEGGAEKRKICAVISSDKNVEHRRKKRKPTSRCNGSTKTSSKGGREMSCAIGSETDPGTSSSAQHSVELELASDLIVIPSSRTTADSGDFSQSVDPVLEDFINLPSSSRLVSRGSELDGRAGTEQSTNSHLILSPYADKAPARRVAMPNAKKAKTKQMKTTPNCSNGGSQNVDVTGNLDTILVEASDNIQDDTIRNIQNALADESNMAGNSEDVQDKDEDSLDGNQELEDDSIRRHGRDDKTKNEQVQEEADRIEERRDERTSDEEEDDTSDVNTGTCKDDEVPNGEEGEEASNDEENSEGLPDVERDEGLLDVERDEELPDVERDEVEGDDPDGLDIAFPFYFGCRIS